MKLTENFDSDEFNCNCAESIPTEYKPNIQVLANNLQVLRDYINQDSKKPKAIHINSAWRSKEHNSEIGGKPHSFHLYGMASDIVVKGINPKKLAEIIEELISQGKMKQGGIGIYKTFVHYDTRGTKARWNG